MLQHTSVSMATIIFVHDCSRTFQQSNLGREEGGVSLGGHYLDLSSDCMPELVVFGKGESAEGNSMMNIWNRQVGVW